MLRECIVCKSSRHVEKYSQLPDEHYLKCTACGLVFVDKLEPATTLYKAYSGSWLKSLRRKIFSPFRRFHHDQNFTNSVDRAQAIFAFASKQATKKGKYLDVGCNKCYLLAQGLSQGWDVYGSELVPELTAPFRNSYKEARDHVFLGRFCDVKNNFEKNSFELITAIDVIEHFEDVEMDLKGILEILKPGGAFVIQTPDIDCDQAKQSGSSWGALKSLEHLHLFNQYNLNTLAGRIGFNKLEYIKTPFEEADGNFVAVLRKP